MTSIVGDKIKASVGDIFIIFDCEYEVINVREVDKQRYIEIKTKNE